MKLLALDSSGLVASVAIVSETGVLAEYTVNYKKTHSQTLLPMLDEVVKMIGIELSEVDGIAIAAGPGSFTGLRIGSATAKGLGLALGKPIIPIPTMDGMAYNLYGTADLICPLMDARRNQVYTGLYEFKDNIFSIVKEQMAVEIYDIVEIINQLGRSVIFLGDGADVYADKIKELIQVPFSFAPIHLNRQRASAIGTLALSYGEDKMVTAANHEPVYLRLSQAERELAEKQASAKEN